VASELSQTYCERNETEARPLPTDIAYSVNGVPIRLTEERWRHIVMVRDDLRGRREDVLMVVEDPDFVLRGYGGALLAVKGYGRGRYLVVVYKELSSHDGFIITAYFTSRPKGAIVWRRS
jgi:hypothetical protein